MYKTSLIREIAVRTGLTQRNVEEVMNAFSDITAEALSKGESVILSGFGTFEPKNRSPRIGRNPHTGEAVEIPARIIPSFKPSQGLKERISCPVANHDTTSHRKSPTK